jgi:hypothetical protein
MIRDATSAPEAVEELAQRTRTGDLLAIRH